MIAAYAFASVAHLAFFAMISVIRKNTMRYGSKGISGYNITVAMPLINTLLLGHIQHLI